MCDPGWSADFKQLELCGAVVRSYFQLLLNILKPVPIFFCCFRESCNAVLLQSSRSDLWFMKLANEQLVNVNVNMHGAFLLYCTEHNQNSAIIRDISNRDRTSCCRTGRSFTAVWQKWGQNLCTHKAFIKKCQLCLSCQLCLIQIRERLRPSAA